jgi:hypothetical protein
MLKNLAVLTLVVLVPLRAVAGATIGFCALGHHDMTVASHGGHDQGAGRHAHGGRDHPAQPVKASCNICVEHCSGAAFAPTMGFVVGDLPVAQDRIFLTEHAAPAFFPDHPDRPPLA